MKHIPSISRIDAFLRAGKFIGNPIREFDRYIAKHGDTFHFFMAGIRPSIVTANPVIIQQVLQKNHRKYEKSRFQADVLSKYVGNGLLTAHGDYWLRQRRLIQPAFHRNRIKNLTGLMKDEISQSISILKFEWKDESSIDIGQLMNTLTFNIIGKTLFSSDISNDGLKELSLFITTFQNFVIKEARLPFLKSWFQLSGQIDKHVRIAQKVREIIGAVIDRRIAQPENDYDDLLQMFLGARYEDSGKPMSRKQLIDECLILFFAGHETSANALTWTMIELAQNSDLRAKVHFESLNKTANTENQFQFTTSVINEALRKYPPAWLIDRVAIEDDQIGGLHIPKGTVFLLYVYGLHHHKDYWQSAEEFSPHRFSPIEDSSFPKNCFYPFGAGPRLCIGNHFAMQEMQLVLTTFLKNFPHFSLTGKKPELQPMITLRPKGDVLFKLFRE